MYIIDKLEMVLESYNNETIEYILSHYLLAHLDSIEECTLKQISIDTKISQASVIRFCQKIGYKGVTQFMSALESEYGDLQARFNFFKKTDINTLEDMRTSFIKECEQATTESILELVKLIHNGHKVMLYGRKSFINSFQYLTAYCLAHHKEVIISHSLSKNHQQKQFESLEKGDVIIIMEPYIEWHTYRELSYLNGEMLDHISQTLAHLVFIGQGISKNVDLNIPLPYTYFDYFYKNCFDHLDFRITLGLKELEE